jgi:signal transduction histidine kinase
MTKATGILACVTFISLSVCGQEVALRQDVLDVYLAKNYKRVVDMADSILFVDDVERNEENSLRYYKAMSQERLEKPVQAVQNYLRIIENSLDISLLSKVHNRVGEIYFDQKSYAQALEHYAKALGYYEKTGNVEAADNVRFKTAVIHLNRHDDDLASNLLHQLLKSDRLDPMRVGLVKEKLGQVYYQMAEFDSCRMFLDQANALYEEHDMISELLQNKEFIVQSFYDEGLYDEASAAALLAADAAIKHGEQGAAAIFLMKTSELYENKRDLRQAIVYQEMAVGLSETLAVKTRLEMQLYLATLYSQTEQDADALLIFHDASQLAKSEEETVWVEKIERKQSDFFLNRKNYQEAYMHLRIADSLRKTNHSAEIRALKREFKLNSTFEEDSFVTQAVEKAESNSNMAVLRLRNILIIGTIFSVVFIVLLYREFVHKRKVSKVLEWKVYRRTRELRRANKELNTYIYKSSHDLRTPLTSIKSLLRLLEKEDHNAGTKKYLGLIQSCTDQMDDILLNLSHAVDYKKVDVKVEQIDFNKLRYQLLEKELINAHSISIEWVIQEKAPFFCDYKLLKVILQQTINNSICYRRNTPQDFCRITIVSDHDGATLTVEDNGLGISDKVRDNVFDMFVKGTNKSTGAGLGLYLVRIAGDKIRAKIQLDSQENEGSKFTFVIPNLN